MVVMKAMGMESDQEVVQLIGRDPRYSLLLLPSIEVIDMYVWLWMHYDKQLINVSFTQQL